MKPHNKNDKHNEAGYDTWSDHYDHDLNPTVAMDDLVLPGFYEQWEGMSVLDIGCGTGRHSRRLVAQGNQVLGMDLSAGMLERARQKIPNTLFKPLQANFMTSDLEDTYFDGVLCSLVLEHMGDLEDFFRKVRRVLRPGAPFLLSELHPLRAKRGSTAHFVSPKGQEVRLSSTAHTSEAIRGAALEAGFRVVLNETVVGSEELSLRHAPWAKYLGNPMIEVWEFG